ncbi:MAG: endonuclease/exonuclease/phosphatase family protein [Actinomycetota bacterium]
MTIRLATWNLRWQFGDYESRQPAIASTLEQVGADVMGLQETWPGQIERLAKHLGAEQAWVGNRWEGAEDDPEKGMGNAVVSKFPILDVEHRFLDDGRGRKYRTVLCALLETPHGVLPFFTTHLNFGYDESEIRIAQLQEISEFIETLNVGDLPPVLCGDLNAVPDSDEIRRLNGRSKPYVPKRIWTDCWEQRGDGDGVTWSEDNPYVNTSAWPNRRLDYMLIAWPRKDRPRGNPASAALFGMDEVEGKVPSDHYGVVVDMITDRTRPSDAAEGDDED